MQYIDILAILLCILVLLSWMLYRSINSLLRGHTFIKAAEKSDRDPNEIGLLVDAQRKLNAFSLKATALLAFGIFAIGACLLRAVTLAS